MKIISIKRRFRKRKLKLPKKRTYLEQYFSSLVCWSSKAIVSWRRRIDATETDEAAPTELDDDDQSEDDDIVDDKQSWDKTIDCLDRT